MRNSEHRTPFYMDTSNPLGTLKMLILGSPPLLLSFTFVSLFDVFYSRVNVIMGSSWFQSVNLSPSSHHLFTHLFTLTQVQRHTHIERILPMRLLMCAIKMCFKTRQLRKFAALGFLVFLIINTQVAPLVRSIL